MSWQDGDDVMKLLPDQSGAYKCVTLRLLEELDGKRRYLMRATESDPWREVTYEEFSGDAEGS